MIVQSEGCFVKSEVVAVGSATMIVSTSGTAYRKTTKVKSVIRFIKKFVSHIKQKVKFVIRKLYINFNKSHTKTGKPSSIEPPANVLYPYF